MKRLSASDLSPLLVALCRWAFTTATYIGFFFVAASTLGILVMALIQSHWRDFDSTADKFCPDTRDQTIRNKPSPADQSQLQIVVFVPLEYNTLRSFPRLNTATDSKLHVVGSLP